MSPNGTSRTSEVSAVLCGLTSEAEHAPQIARQDIRALCPSSLLGVAFSSPMFRFEARLTGLVYESSSIRKPVYMTVIDELPNHHPTCSDSILESKSLHPALCVRLLLAGCARLICSSERAHRRSPSLRNACVYEALRLARAARHSKLAPDIRPTPVNPFGLEGEAEETAGFDLNAPSSSNTGVREVKEHVTADHLSRIIRSSPRTLCTD
jgi:hypothetical protein